MLDPHEYLNHAGISPSSTKDLIPALVGGAIEFDSITPLSSQSVVEDMVSHGASIDHLDLALYPSSALGKSRRLDNEDCLVGYSPLYDDLSHFKSIYLRISEVIRQVKQTCEPAPLISSMEMQDLEKVCLQRWKPPGYHVHMPFSPDIKHDAYPAIFVKALKTIARVYREKASEMCSLSLRELIMLDSDPPETNTGLPTLAAGDDTHLSRMQILSAVPPPVGKPDEWIKGYMSLSAQLGFHPEFLFSAILATRHGPTRKPIPMFVPDPMGFTANKSSIGLYGRTRFVYPIPYAVNFLLSPVYVALKDARQKILGLWHDPKSMGNYVNSLKKQGSMPYSADFSGMDTTMPPHLIMLICSVLIEAGFPAYPLWVLKEAAPILGVAAPSYENTSRKVTWIHRFVSWMSGFKLTSEFDTIFGLATILSVLEQMGVCSIEDWANGKFIVAELGDDVFFTVKKSMDMDLFAELAKKIAGADVKLFEDAMFLKRFLPMTQEIPRLTRPFSRFIQQTFANEDKYDGEKGGRRPDAILRLALSARFESLDLHPMFSKLWPAVCELVEMLGFVRRSSPDYISNLRKGKVLLQEGDEMIILQYSEQNSLYIDRLRERAKYEPSAAALMARFSELGVSANQNPASAAIRKAYCDAFFTKPTHKSVVELSHSTSWIFNSASSAI